MPFEKVTIGDATLYCGDCLEIMPTLGKVDAVVTDPPYGINGGSGTISKQRGKGNYDTDLFVDDESNIINNIIPAVKMALSLSVDGVGIVTPGPRHCFKYPEPTEIGFVYQPASCGMSKWGRCTAQPLLYYGRDPRRGKEIHPIHYQLTEAPEKSIHPCPKPTKFMNWLVYRASLENTTILDPFMGSGTTGIVSVQNARNFIGIELEPKYFDIACKRIEEAQKQLRLF